MFVRLNQRKSEIERLKAMQKEQINDDYSCGIYNGLELASAVLDGREPEFAVFVSEPEVLEGKEEKLGRTAFSGVRKVVKK